ncbi:MAG: RNA-binding protein [Candidatus Omnitrophica bacterium]|nr:RNA-binding protein [Candidatus Omnitrophota bacterium]
MKEKKLFVGNLSYSTNEGELREMFARFGTVENVNIIPNKGFGFVEMSSLQEAEAAKTGLNLTMMGGRNISVDEARPPKVRPRQDFRRY